MEVPDRPSPEVDLDRERKPDKFTVEIDFNGAQKAWRQNKKAYPNGYFQYRCGEIRSKGGVCRFKPQAIRREEQRRRHLSTIGDSGISKSPICFGEWSPCWHHLRVNQAK